MTVSGTLPAGTRERDAGSTDRTGRKPPRRRHVTFSASSASPPARRGHSWRNSSPSPSSTPPFGSFLAIAPSSPLKPTAAKPTESTARIDPAAATDTVDAVTSPSVACSTVPADAGSSRTSAKVRYADSPRCVAVNGAIALSSATVSSAAFASPPLSAGNPTRTPRSSAASVTGGPSLRHST